MFPGLNTMLQKTNLPLACLVPPLLDPSPEKEQSRECRAEGKEQARISNPLPPISTTSWSKLPIQFHVGVQCCVRRVGSQLPNDLFKASGARPGCNR